MHELWLCKRILTVVTQALAERPEGQIKTIILELGLLQAIDQEALRFNFQVLAKNTPAEKANLQFEMIPGLANCRGCQQLINLNQYGQACPHCGSYDLQWRQGEEFKIKAMEVV